MVLLSDVTLFHQQMLSQLPAVPHKNREYSIGLHQSLEVETSLFLPLYSSHLYDPHQPAAARRLSLSLYFRSLPFRLLFITPFSLSYTFRKGGGGGEFFNE